MAKRRTMQTVRLGAIARDGGVSKSVDLSSFTSAILFISSTGVGAKAQMQTEISPDGFDVADGSATWFEYSGTIYKMIASGGNAYYPPGEFARPMPDAQDTYGVGNSSAPCGRRMRAKNSGSAVGVFVDADDSYVEAHRRVA